MIAVLVSGHRAAIHACRAHHWVPAGVGMSETTVLARKSARLSGRPQAVHAHAKDAPCNERCDVIAVVPV